MPLDWVPNEVFTQMVSSTREDFAKSAVSQISEHNALLWLMERGGNMRPSDGGRSIVRQLEYGQNKTVQRFRGLQKLNVEGSTILTSCVYDYVQMSVHVTASNREINQNSGENAMLDLAEIKRKNALESAANTFAIDLHGDGSLDEQINGLQNFVQTTGQGTIGGINAADEVWWRNRVQDVGDPSEDFSNPTEVAGRYIKRALDKMLLQITIGKQRPNVLLMSHDFYSCFEQWFDERTRYEDKSMADAGFQNIKYKGIPIVFDENANFGSNAEKCYLLNWKYLYLIYHEKANWTAAEKKVPIDQDGVILPFFWMGNVICTNRRMQGLVYS